MSLKPLKKSDLEKGWMKKRRIVHPKMQMVISMCGLYMILMIFQQIISIGPQSFVCRTVLLIYNTMQSGQINVSNFGIYCIFAIFILIFTDKATGPSLPNGLKI